MLLFNQVAVNEKAKITIMIPTIGNTNVASGSIQEHHSTKLIFKKIALNCPALNLGL